MKRYLVAALVALALVGVPQVAYAHFGPPLPVGCTSHWHYVITLGACAINR